MLIRNSLIKEDLVRYPRMGVMPKFQYYYRKVQASKTKLGFLFYKVLFRHYKRKNFILLSEKNNIGAGLYFGHPYCITINPNVVIGKNCNIHKGVTIGQENRGTRKGAPTIGDNVYIGINATVVGNITIGSDVLIAPNSYVNCDIPSHSIVLGNPCKIIHKDNATEGYINDTV